MTSWLNISSLSIKLTTEGEKMINLKKILLTFLAFIFTISLTVQSANAGNITINLGHGNTEGSAYDPLAKKFAELAEKYSNGSIKVKVRCCAQLV